MTRIPASAPLLLLVAVGCGDGAPPALRLRAPEPAPRLPAAEAPRPLELCAGLDHTCALLDDGGVACWGDNLDYQSAPDERATVPAPTRVAFPAAAAVHCGPRETCARTRAGEVHCIGGGVRAIERVPLPSPALDVALARRGGCALDGSEHVRCWTDGARDRLEVRHVPGATELALHPQDGGRVCALDGSPRASCFLLERPGDVSVARESVRPSGGAVRAAGYAHECAIESGAIRCSGASSYGQLGDGRSREHPRPVEVQGIDGAVSIATGGDRVCALGRNGEVWCWGRAVARAEPPLPGRPATGRLEDADFAPRLLEMPARVLELRLGAIGLPCVRTARGWRCLYGDQWRPDRTLGGTRPTALEEAGAPAVVQVARDGRCGVTRRGRVVCAVLAAHEAERAHAAGWITLPGEERFVEVAPTVLLSGVAHVCARTAEGAVRCFRISPSGEAMRAHAQGIEALAGVAQLDAASSAYAALVCARGADGSVRCFGDDRFGRLGPSPRAPNHDALAPVPIEGLPRVSEIAVGAAHACARTAEGRVWCWGSNREGAAPDGSAGRSSEPVSVVWPPAPAAAPD
ncbi:MAG TPA: hypothetical protein VIL20_25420 [Sandaracinaceae bacterium]